MISSRLQEANKNAIYSGEVNSENILSENMAILESNEHGKKIANQSRQSLEMPRDARTLSLVYCKLHELDDVCFEALCHIIMYSKLTSLDLRFNCLLSLSEKNWEKLFVAIKHSRLTFLDLNECSLDQAMKYDEQVDLVTKNIISSISYSCVDISYLYSAIIANPFLIVNGLPDSTPRFIIKLIKKRKVDKETWGKCIIARDNLYQTAVINPAIWLNITPSSVFFRPARVDLFNILLSMSNILFIVAMTVLIDDDGRLIALDKDNQLIFDRYLSAAILTNNLPIENRELLSMATRLAMLQYLILGEVMHYLKATPVITNKRVRHLFEGLMLHFPADCRYDQFNNLKTQELINILWRISQKRKYKADIIPKNDNTNRKKLINAVTLLGKEVYPVFNTSTV